uniref:Uncharacterized protein n=1 Tax=Fagus sylvatica TaxID=28930 RepID=A0A2N9I0U5_FAGSY
MPEPIQSFSSATATPHSPSTTLKQQNQTHSPSTAISFSSDPKPMLGASSNNRLSYPSRNVVVPIPEQAWQENQDVTLYSSTTATPLTLR